MISCKSAKVNNITTISKNNTAKEIVLAHNARDFKFETLQSKMRLTYDDGKKSFSPSVTLRMEKDKQIWMSLKVLGITMGKALITPNSVSFYEKLNRQFYKGDFTALSDILGTEVSFPMLQNLLIGQSMVPLNTNFELNNLIEDQTQLTPKTQNELYSLLVSLYNINVKVAHLKLSNADSNIKINYEEYQKIEGQDFPKSVYIISKENNGTKKIDLDFKTVTINENFTFPYTVPDGYKELQLK